MATYKGIDVTLESNLLLWAVTNHHTTPREMFNSVDLNNDGKVTLDEFLNALSRRPASQYSDEELRKAFKELDKSGDGKLDVSEIRSLLEKCGKKWSDDNIQKTIKELDKDGDGKINYNEFLDLLKG